MKTFFDYFWQANLAWLLLYAIYWAFLRRDTFFRWNRFYLLAASIFALAFPFLPIPTLLQDAVPEDQVLLFFGGNEVEIPIASTTQVETSTVFTWENSLLALYFVGVIFLLVRLIFSLFSISKLIFVHGIRRMKGGYFMVQTKAKTPIFSFMNILFWNEPAAVSEEEKAKILAHELVHIRQWHSLDVLFMEILAIIFWCNPVAWAYKKSLQAIHEYLADAKVLNKGMSKTEYANLLVSQFLHTDTLYLTNHFLNKSLLKNRIMMIHQKKSTQKAFVKFAFVVPIIVGCFLISAFSEKKETLNKNQQSQNTQKVNFIPKDTVEKNATAYLFYPSDAKEGVFAGIFRNDAEKKLFEMTIPCEEDKQFSDKLISESHSLPSSLGITSVRKIYFETINLTVTKLKSGEKKSYKNIFWEDIDKYSEKGDETYFEFNNSKARNAKGEWISIGELCPSFSVRK